MQLIDYNGQGIWSRAEILSRYAHYAAKLNITPRDLSPKEFTEGDRHWIYPVMERVIAGIEANDPACIRLGIEFIEEDAKFKFGKSLKATTARALRRAALADDQKHRILRRIFAMLAAGHVPHEYREYSKLARAIGFDADDVPEVETTNPYVARFHRYFLMKARPQH